MALITGPNMAGKTTYLKQICLLQLLAQTGCFVPAEFGAFPRINRIFSRIGHNDDLSSNLSAFAVEVSEIVPVLANADSSSLIVIDEFARSTAMEEGIGICYAICEELIRAEAYVLFSTHFLSLSSLTAGYDVVEDYHFSTISKVVCGDDGNAVERLTHTHRLYKGPYKGPLYGFDLVELSTFPREIIEEERDLAIDLRNQNAWNAENDDEWRMKRALLRLGNKLRSVIPILNASNSRARAKYLNDLRSTFIQNITPQQSS